MRKITKTIRILLAIAKQVLTGRGGDFVYESKNRLKGLDLKFASVEDLGLRHERSHWYSDSGGPEFFRALKRLRIPAGSVALDLGSGKGGAAITLSRFPFVEVLGVELSEELVKIARANVSRLRLSHVRFIQSDAARFTDLDRITHIYMYNPFPCSVMEDVIRNLTASLVAVDRHVTLIYRNPLCHDMMLRSGLFEKTDEWVGIEHQWYIYEHVPSTQHREAPPS